MCIRDSLETDETVADDDVRVTREAVVEVEGDESRVSGLRRADSHPSPALLHHPR